jgi:hypothetical protein
LSHMKIKRAGRYACCDEYMELLATDTKAR